MRKIFYVTTFIVLLLVSFLGITYSYEISDGDTLKFELVGPETLYIDVFSEYREYGVKVYSSGVDVTSSVSIDSSMINTSELGEYKVKYSYLNEYIYRNVLVIDNEKPEITLKGDNKVYILLNGSYVEDGYSANDNYDGDLTDKVEIDGSVNTKKEGTYTLEYKVSDSSGNVGTVTRDVIVKKPVITVDSGSGNRVSTSSYNVTSYSNTIYKNSFTNTGIYYEGYMKEKSDTYKIKLINRDSSLEYVFNMSTVKDNYYKGSMDLTTVSNGIYDLYIVGKKTEKLQNRLGNLYRIIRAKVGNKLVTLMYENDLVSIEIEDFKYQYDFVIDPGHGGTDIGAANGLVAEKDMNLKVSKYEKCRYESMGYKVYMIRNDDTYGEMMGSTNLEPLQRRAITIGYYGAVSRISYSNHHNGSVNTSSHGFEIIVTNQASANDLIVETSLYNKFKKYYGITDNAVRLYSKDYDTSKVFNKLNGAIYSNMNYYAVIRTPYEQFNVKNVIYEPIYLSNTSDFNWYWSNKNWIKVSEIKIQEYVNYLGGEYIADNSSCL